MLITNRISGLVKPSLITLSISHKLLIRKLSNLKPHPSRSNFDEKVQINIEKNGRIVNEKVLVNELEIHSETFGNGPHVALLLPGMLGSIESNWLPVINKMDLEKFTLVGWDPPGYGKSRPPELKVFRPEYCLIDDARLASSLMKRLGYNLYSVIGWSHGGATAALIAANFPSRVKKVVMCNTPLNYNDHLEKMMSIMTDLKRWKPEQLQVLLCTYEMPYLRKMLDEWMAAFRTKKIRDSAKYMLEEIKTVRAPILHITSLKDCAVPTKDVEDFGKLFHNCRVHKVPIGGHQHLEFLDDFVAATEDFLCT